VDFADELIHRARLIVGDDLRQIEIRRILRVQHVFDLPRPAVRAGPAAQRHARNLLADEPAELIRMFDATWRIIAFIAAENDKRAEAQRIGPLREFQTVLQRMLRRQDRHNVRPVRFGSEIDRHVTQVRLLTPTDGAIGHEHKPAKRRDFPHQAVAVDPGIDAAFQRQVHPRRTHLDVEEESLRTV
jgi:hypothetical protein